MTDEDVWAWGDTWVAHPTGRKVCGRGDFSQAQLSDVQANGHVLVIVPDEPPERHANVGGWPPADRKEVRKNLAQLLAAKADPVLRDTAYT